MPNKLKTNKKNIIIFTEAALFLLLLVFGNKPGEWLFSAFFSSIALNSKSLAYASVWLRELASLVPYWTVILKMVLASLFLLLADKCFRDWHAHGIISGALFGACAVILSAAPLFLSGYITFSPIGTGYFTELTYFLHFGTICFCAELALHSVVKRIRNACISLIICIILGFAFFFPFYDPYPARIAITALVSVCSAFLYRKYSLSASFAFRMLWYWCSNLYSRYAHPHRMDLLSGGEYGLCGLVPIVILLLLLFILLQKRKDDVHPA